MATRPIEDHNIDIERVVGLSKGRVPGMADSLSFTAALNADFGPQDFASDVRVMRARGRMILPQEEEPGRQNGCHFSGDGSFVIYHSDAFGDRELVARSLADGVPVRVSRIPGGEQFVGTLPIR